MWHNFSFFLQHVKAERFLHCGFGSFGHEAVAEIRIQREKYETSVRKPDVPAVDGFVLDGFPNGVDASDVGLLALHDSGGHVPDLRRVGFT